MNIENVLENLRKNRFEACYFETKEEAAAYLGSKIDGKVVGFGDSATLATMGLYDILSTHNEVRDPARTETDEEFVKAAHDAMVTDIFVLSANGISEDGQLVNIDGTGNRVAGSLFGHEKVYFVAGTNKIAPTLEDAIYRARNVAAPMDSKKLCYKNPCSEKGDKCYDCSSPERICNALTIYMKKMNDMDMEVVLIGESLGF